MVDQSDVESVSDIMAEFRESPTEENRHPNRVDSAKSEDLKLRPTSGGLERVRTSVIVPAWVQKLSVVLNSPKPRNWRTLAQKFGYNQNETANWTKLSDPCAAMLTDWFRVKGLNFAAASVLKELYELQRDDAVPVVENALREPDSAFDEPKEDFRNPPPLFLSYHWSDLVKAKSLKEVLKAAGYDCWLDTGHMQLKGTLQSKVDNGLHSSRVVLLVMTEKYAGSAYGEREVQVADSLGKTIITLLVEKQTWPPTGKVGRLITSKPYIRFYQAEHEISFDSRFWPEDNFDELMEKLKTAVPMTSTVLNERQKKSAKVGHVVILCTSDKKRYFDKLDSNLKECGYKCQIETLENANGALTACNIVIISVDNAFLKSQLGKRLLDSVENNKKAVIPLQLDPGRWPLSAGKTSFLGKLIPVDCSAIGRFPAWMGDELDEILDRLESYAPEVKRKKRRDEVTGVPKAKNHHTSRRMEKPKHALAREASDIRILVRPPTPKKVGSSHIPISVRQLGPEGDKFMGGNFRKPRRKQSAKKQPKPPEPVEPIKEEDEEVDDDVTDSENSLTDSDESVTSEDSEQAETSSDDESVVSDVSEVQTKVESRLPDIRNRNQSQPNYTKQQPVPAKPRVITRSKSNPGMNASKPTYTGNEMPKLPSLYRQKNMGRF